MSKSPLLNALLATLYISVIATIMYYGPEHVGFIESPLAPIVGITFFLSLFVFSAAMVGYLLLLQPIQLYLEGKKQEAVNLFLNTIAIFGGTTMLLFLTLSWLVPTL